VPTPIDEMLIVKDSAYSVEGRYAGRRADLRAEVCYPVEAICLGCGHVVRREKPEPGRLDWNHTGRRAGEP
jgi:hypothetical protein